MKRIEKQELKKQKKKNKSGIPPYAIIQSYY